MYTDCICGQCSSVFYFTGPVPSRPVGKLAVNLNLGETVLRV